MSTLDQNDQKIISIAWCRLRRDVGGFHQWRWRKKTILQAMSGHCQAGTVTGLFGPSGSGKTSLLNILSGSSTPSSGQLYLGRTAGLETSPVSYYIRQHVHEGILGELSVGQILRYAYAFKNGRGSSSKEVEEHIEKTMRALFLPVEELLSRRYEQCSGGEQKRVAIAQELMAKEHSAQASPSFLFLDEPTTGLDSVSAFEVILCLHQLTRSHPQMTIIASIHAPNGETLSLFDSVYVLSKGGRAIYSGPPTQVKDSLKDTIQFTQNNPPIEVLLKEACQGIDSPNIPKLARQTQLKEASTIERHMSSLVLQPAGFRCTRKAFRASDFVTSLLRQLRITFLAQLSTLLFMPSLYFGYFSLLSNVMAFNGTARSKCSLKTGVLTNNNNNSKDLSCVLEDPLQLNDPEQRNVYYLSLVLVFIGLLIISTSTILFTKHLQIFQREHRNYWYSVGVNFWSSSIVSFLELSLNVCLISGLSYFLSGQHLDEEQFNWSRLALYTLFLWCMCIYYQALGQLIGSALMNYHIVAICLTMLIFAVFTLFNGLFVKLHRTADVLFEQIGAAIGMVYAIRGIHFAIFVFDRCKGEGQFSEVTVDFDIEVEQLDVYVLRVLGNVLALKVMTFLVLYVKFNDWRRRGRKRSEASSNETTVDRSDFSAYSKSETKPSNREITVQCSSGVISQTAAQLQGKIVIAWKNLSLFQSSSLYDFGSRKNKSNQKSILRSLDGQFCFGTLNALMGTSGAGKTSLLRVLNGQLKARLSDETEIYLSKLTSIRTCFITQEISDHLMKGLTGRQLVMYASKLKNVSSPSASHEEITAKWLHELDIEETANTPVERCSGGERKRLAVALELTALEMPNLVCLDEPTSGLDSHSAEVVISTLKRVAGSHPLSIVTSIHQPTAEVLHQFSQLYILARGGVCIYSGTPAELQEYANQVPELLSSSSTSSNNIPPIELLIRQSCAAWPDELTSKLNQLTPKLDTKGRDLLSQAYLTVDGVAANRNRFTVHSLTQLGLRRLQYIRAYLWKEWTAFTIVYILLAANLRLIFTPEMIYSSSCLNPELEDLKSCVKSAQKLHDELLLKDNFMCIFYAFVVFNFFPLLYSAVSLHQELGTMKSEHRNGWYSTGAFYLVRSLLEVIPLLAGNLIFVLIFNIYEPVVGASLYAPFWLILSLSQFGLCAMSQCITLLSGGGRNFSLSIVTLAGAFFFAILISGVYVPLSQMHYAYRLLSVFSIPRFSFHLPMMLLYGFGRCSGKEVSSILYMLELEDADYLPALGMLLGNALLYRLLALCLLARQLTRQVGNRKSRVARIVQHQAEMRRVNSD